VSLETDTRLKEKCGINKTLLR